MDVLDQPSLLQIQTGLFAALVGVLAAKGAASRQEFAEALDILARHEQDTRIAVYYEKLGQELRGASPKAPTCLKLIAGGLDENRSPVSA